MRALEEQGRKPLSGGFEGLDRSLLDVPEVWDPDVAEMLGELSDTDAHKDTSDRPTKPSKVAEPSMNSHTQGQSPAEEARSDWWCLVSRRTRARTPTSNLEKLGTC